MMTVADVSTTASFLAQRFDARPSIALVLGSGLGALADAFADPVSVPYRDIPGMPATSIVGHAGRMVSGRLEGVNVLAMQGRLHPYEGHDLATVVLGVRAMLKLGAGILIVSNAAGGLDPNIPPGSLLAIDDHLNLSGRSCLVGPNDAELGPRFPDMSEPYDKKLIALAHEVAKEAGVTLHQGVYAGVLGPAYETPAEVRMLRMLGASAVGMSTVQEVIAAKHMGARVLGLSCVTNLASGLSPEPLSHADVERTAKASAGALTSVVRGVVRRLGAGA
jgi:purine-nucleoside phosphorylase